MINRSYDSKAVGPQIIFDNYRAFLGINSPKRFQGCHVNNSRYKPFLRSSGLPFLTVARTISPLAAAGNRFNRPRIPPTAIMYRFLAPVLSAQLITAPTGRPREIRNLAPAEPPRPVKTNKILDNSRKGHHSND